MIYVTFKDNWDELGTAITVFSVNSFYDFTEWLNGCDPKELYVTENREDILKYIDRMVD